MSTAMVLGGLALTLVSQTGRPHSVSASNQGLTAHVAKGSSPHADTFLLGAGIVSLDLTDRIRGAAAMAGDSGRLYARFSSEGSSYEIHLDRIGFNAADLSSGALRRHPIEGGVMFDRWLHGATGLGSPAATLVHAMAAVWGVGRVVKDGQTLTDRALIHAAALDRGSHSDDSTHRMLPQARAGDGEIFVIAENLPPAAEPSGFVQVEFDNVRISYDSQSLALATDVPNVPDTGSTVATDAAAAPIYASGGGAGGEMGIGGSGLGVETGTGGSGLAAPAATPLAYLPMSAVTLLPGTLTTPAAPPRANPLVPTPGTATPPAPPGLPSPPGSTAPGVAASPGSNAPPGSTMNPTPTLPGTGTLPAIGGNPGMTPGSGSGTVPATGGSSGLVSSVRPSSPESVSPGIPATPQVLTSDTTVTQPASPQIPSIALPETPQVLRSGTTLGPVDPSAPATPLPPVTPIANNGSQVAPLPATPAPSNASGATPLPQGISPANALPAANAPSVAPVR